MSGVGAFAPGPLALAVLAVVAVLVGRRRSWFGGSGEAGSGQPDERVPRDRLSPLRERWRSSRNAADRRDAELEWVEALGAELSAGRDPASALIAASAGQSSSSRHRTPVCPHAVAAARAGADVGPALIADGRQSETVRAVAACWEVASGSGAGLGASLLVLADAARETERVRRELQAGLAEPRATAVVLAMLPLVGLLLGSLLGADPLHWLLGSRLGPLVLAAGLTLEAVGAWWAWRIASALEAQL